MSPPVAQIDLEQLEAGLDEVGRAPAAEGRLELIARRPEAERRELLERGALDLEVGLVGDIWSRRPSSSRGDGKPDPLAQVTVMNARLAALVSGSEDRERWALAGDQLYVDLDLGEANLPAGARLAIGAQAVLEVTEAPHLGCGKFSRRFGTDALKLVNSEVGRAMRLRGLNARVVGPGEVAAGDAVRKLG